MQSSEEIRKKIISELPSLGAEFAFLFGSIIKPTFGAESDVDLAIYFQEPPQSFDDRMKVMNQLSRDLDRELDLIVLNDCDIIIAMQVLANGERIWNPNPGRFVEYKARKISEYIDFKRSRKVIEDHLLRGK